MPFAVTIYVPKGMGSNNMFLILVRPMLYLRSGSYLWMTVLMGIFYTLPVLQLVLFYQETSGQLGPQSACMFTVFTVYNSS